MKRLILAISLATLGFGCSLAKDTQEMKETTDQLNQKSENLLDATCKLSRLSVKGGSYDLLKDAIDLDSLFNPKVKGAEKLGYAQVVFEAMTWQTWDAQCSDSPDRLDWYYEKSVLLLFSQIHDHIDDSLPVDASTLNPLDDNDWNALAALGAKMDIIDRDYEANMKAAGLPVMSYYDLIVSALKMEDAYNRGERVPRYVVEVLKWKPEMVYLLQLRHNYIAGVIMVLATDVEDSLVSMGKLVLFKRDVSLAKLTARVDQYLDWLKDIKQTRKDLKDLGYKVRLNEKFATAMGNINWIPSAEKELPEKVRNTETEFIRTYSEIVKENAKIFRASVSNRFGGLTPRQP